MQKQQTFDYIIVGGGSAGCVLANRLSEEPSHSVLLIEAGRKDDSWKIHMPAALMYNLTDDRYNWYYHTEPQALLDQRRMYWPRGKVLGGSSALNAMVYIRGHAADYDRWQAEGATGWSYADVLPYFKTAENSDRGANFYRGDSGPLHVTTGPCNNPLYQAFIVAGQQAGYPYTEDMNGAQQEGLGPMDMTIFNGKRWSSAQAYWHPISHRPNLLTLTQAHATRILFEKNKAIGITWVAHGKAQTAFAEREVILCGGAINSPQLLMLSGIGAADALKKQQIPVVADLPGVGQNLQDHLEIYIQQRCKKPITLYREQKQPWKTLVGLRWFLSHSGAATSSHLEAGGFVKSNEHISHPNIQFHFLPSLVIDHGRKPINQHAYQVHVGPMRPTSKGTITLQSNNPFDPPLIQPNYLQTPEDREEMRQCVKISRELFAQAAFDEFRDIELAPGPTVKSDAEIDAFIRQQSDSAYHPSCTCKMGSDALAVVDPELKVHGIEHLRIVDASIMPSIISGNLNAPTIMIAEKAADIILHKAPLPPAALDQKP